MDGDYKSKLLEIMPSPHSKPFVNNGNWEKYQIDHMVFFSPDYIDFISIYGSGSIDALDDLQFYSPWYERDNSSWHQFADRTGWAMNKLAKKGKRQAWADEYQYFYYPMEDGIVPLAIDNNGNVLSQKKSRSKFATILHNGVTAYETYDYDLLKFLYNILTNRIDSFFYPQSDREPVTRIMYTPY